MGTDGALKLREGSKSMRDRVHASTRRNQTLDDYLTRLGRLWLFPLVVFGVGLAAYTVYQVHLHGQRTLQSAAETLALKLDADLQRRLHGLKTLSVTTERDHNLATLLDWHHELRAYDLAFDTAVALLEDGGQDGPARTLLSSRLPLGSVAPAVPAPVQALIEQQGLSSVREGVGDVMVGAVIPEPLVPLVAWIGKPRGRVLVGALLTAKVRELIAQQGLPAHWQLTVFDGRNRMVASVGGAKRPWDVSPSAPSWAPEALTTTATLNEAPWRVSIQTDVWSFFRPHFQVMGILASGLSAALLCAALVTRKAQARLVSAVRRLHTPRSASAGDEDPPTTTPPITEVDEAREAMARLQTHQQTVALEAQDAERERIARELHDGLQQNAAVARLHLDLTLARTDLDEVTRRSLERARVSIDKINQEIQNVVMALRPHSLARLGLAVALEELVDILAGETALQVELEIVGQHDAADRLPGPVTEALYRIAQESLNNVRKHARASFVHVVLDVSEPSRVTLSVSDDGVGLPEAERGSGQGLRGMAERAAALGATLTIERGHPGDPTRGTTVTALVPLGE